MTQDQDNDPQVKPETPDLSAGLNRGMLHLSAGDANWEPTPEEMDKLVAAFKAAEIDSVGETSIPGTFSRQEQPFDIVQKPKHYNDHPSGVEAIELCELMTFNAGNCFKYLYRRGSKGNLVQDLDKALWYARRESDRIDAMTLSQDERRWKIHNLAFGDVERTKISKILDSESGPDGIANVYEDLLRPCRYSQFTFRLKNLVIPALELLLKEAQNAIR